MTKKNLAIIFLTALVCLPAASSAQTSAPTPNILLTWKSNTYVPPGFSGKIMPTAGSLISASAELIDGGKIIDASRQTVYWYQDNNFIDGGIGKQSISFRVPDIAGRSINLRVEFPNYSGGQLKTAAIKIARPEVVIESPLPGGRFSSSPLMLAAQPYFFNTVSPSNLIFNWNVNGQAPTGAENPQILNIKFDQAMQAQSTMLVSLSVQNSDKNYDYETASKNITLTYSP